MKTRPDDFDATVITTYPGAPYYDDAIETAPGVWTYSHPKTGDRLHSQELDYTVVTDSYKGIPGEYKAYTWTDHLSSADLVRLRDEMENRLRAKLNIPFNAGAPGVRFETSMGMTKLPPTILRQSVA